MTSTRIKKKTLIDASSILAHGLAKQDIVEEFTHFRFHDHTISTFNDLIGVSIKIDADLEGRVNCKQFRKVVGNLKSEYVELEFLKDKLVINGDDNSSLSLEAIR